MTSPATTGLPGVAVLTDAQLERYNRQLLINDFDIAGQEKLQAATVLVLGLGGLGNPAALYLGAAGVGRLLLADGDRVEATNLQRQIAHTEADVGLNKAQSAAAAVRAINSGIEVEVIEEFLAAEQMAHWVAQADLVVDCSDNYPARFDLNRACIAHRVPLVSAAAVRSEGQIAVFDPARGGPCYRCLYTVEGASTALSCAESGVLAPVVGVLGSLQAMEALKVIADYGESLRGRLLMLDLRTMDIQRLQLNARGDCPDCQALR